MGCRREIQAGGDGLAVACLALLNLVLDVLLGVVGFLLIPDGVNSRHHSSSIRFWSHGNLVLPDSSAAESFQACPLWSDYIFLWSHKLTRFKKFVGFWFIFSHQLL